jgi:hypothetical protein
MIPPNTKDLKDRDKEPSPSQALWSTYVQVHDNIHLMPY